MTPERSERVRRERELVDQLSRNSATASGDLESVARLITESCAELLDVERTGVWLFDETETKLKCIDQFNLSSRTHSPGAILHEHEFRSEFTALKGSLYVDADDPLTDPRTAGYVEGYLEPNRITSMLDMVIRFGGRNLGALCFEHVDRPHAWEQHEIDFGCMVAAQLSILLERRELKRAEGALQLAERQLRQAHKMEAVGRLAGGVAHDFNNILQVIGASSELLVQRLGPDDRSRELAMLINVAVQRGAAVTSQLLALSRQQLPDARALELGAVVADGEKMLRRLIGEDIDLRVVRAEVPGWVRADPTQVLQVVLNLALNARDAMPDGGRLTIESANVERGPASVAGPYVLLTVADTGYGMSDDVKSHLFEPFFTTKEVGRGTGLGLSTVYGIVHQYGGGIAVESEVGAGATFKIYLPRVEAPADEAGRTAGRPSFRGSGTVLLVEDDERVRQVVLEIVQARGYDVLAPSGPEEALVLARDTTEPISVLLTDVVMPRMNGRDLARRVVELHPETQVVFMSGYAADVIGSRIDLGGARLLRKPFTEEALLGALADCAAEAVAAS